MQPNQAFNQTEATLHAIDYWQVLKNRYGVILLTFLLVFITAAVITHTMPKKYESVTTVQINPMGTYIDPVGQRRANREGMTNQFFQTQFAIIESDKTLELVMKDLQLASRWDMRPNDVIMTLKGMLKIKQERGTDNVDIAVRHGEPDVAKEVCSAVARAYEQRRIQSEKSNIDEALQKLRDELEVQEDQVAHYKQLVDEHSEELGIPYWDRTATGMRTDPADEDFRREQQRLNEVQHETEKLKLLVDKLSSLSNEELISHVSGLSMDETAVVARRYEEWMEAKNEAKVLLTSGYGKRHPKVVAATDLMEELKKDLDAKVLEVRSILVTRLSHKKKELAVLKVSLKEKAEKRMRTASAVSEMQGLVNDYEDARKILNVMKQNELIERAEQKLTYKPIRVHAEAREASTYVFPNWKINLSLGAAAGLIFGVGIALLLEFMDTSVKSIEDVERYLKVPVLAVIPQEVGVLHSQQGASPDAEAYRILRTNIEFNRKNSTDNSITVVSGGAGEGKSTTLVNLAYICAQGGYSTLMIDADLRRPRLHTFFDINNSVGLTNYLTTDLPLEDVVLQTPVENLYFMPSGILPQDAAGILNSRRMSELIQDVKQRFDLVLIDSPPILGVSDASVLASEVDLTMVVVQHRKLPRNMLVRVVQAVENVGGTVLGVVLNNVDVRSDSQYQYYTSYYTYYSPTEAAAPQKKSAAGKTAASPQGGKPEREDLY